MQNYAIVDDNIIKENRKTFEELPNLSQPIDVYFKKQERCKKISVDNNVEISNADIVVKLQLPIGQTGLVSGEYTKWCAKPVDDRNWTNAKKHFRKALRDAQKVAKMTEAHVGLTTNATIEEKACDEAKYKISSKLGVAFNNLVMAAQAKAERIDDLTKSVSDLTTTMDRLTKRNEELVKQIKRLKGGDSSEKPTKQGGAFKKDGFKLNGYCWTCGYKVKGSHHSGTCRFKSNPGHQTGATCSSPMGGSKINAGFGNKPNGLERK